MDGSSRAVGSEPVDGLPQAPNREPDDGLPQAPNREPDDGLPQAPNREPDDVLASESDVESSGVVHPGPSRWHRAWRGRFRWWTRVGAVLLVVLLGVFTDLIVLSARIDHVAVVFPAGGSGQTYVIVGSDSRAQLPAGADPTGFGSTEAVPGARADLVLVVHTTPSGQTHTLSVPRDLLVQYGTGTLNRLALAFGDGPQSLVDGLCDTLGIPADHLIVVDFAAFESIVDLIGGVDITPAYPVRDSWSGLDLPTPGPQRVGGPQALALVRSRHPEQLRSGRWTPLPDGAAERTRWGGIVFEALRGAAGRARTDPVLAQRLAWAATGSLTTDSGTGVFDLARLAGAAGTPTALPVKAIAGSDLAVSADADTYAALQAAGFDRSCRAG